jgi:4-aminobutyrate aminotransferase-like enzyme
MGQLSALEPCYGVANYKPLPVTLVRGEGVCVWDEQGCRYLDMIGAYSAASFSHCHLRLVEALTQQARRLDAVSRAYFTARLGSFLARAFELTDGEWTKSAMSQVQYHGITDAAGFETWRRMSYQTVLQAQKSPSRTGAAHRDRVEQSPPTSRPSSSQS